MLEGLKVVEFATYVAGPGAAGVMADWGASVIKIESHAGDPTRGLHLGPPEQPGSAVFAMDNRGKRGVVLDIGRPEGRAALIRILADADIFITNLRPPALKRAGLDYDSLKEALPKLIYCSVSGYGLEGEGVGWPAFDMTAFWTRSGVGGATLPENVHPFLCRPGFGDHVTALAGLSAVLAAVIERGRTGKGRLVETSLIRAGVYALSWDMACQLKLGEVTTAQPREKMLAPLSGFFRTRDGKWFATLPRTPNCWPTIAAAANRAEYIDDPRFATPELRAANGPALHAVLDAGFAEVTLDEVGQKLTAADVAWAPLQRPAEVVEDPQAIAAGCIVETPDGQGGAFRAPAGPVRFPGADDGPSGPPPGHGQHTREVLAEAGYSAAEVEALVASGAALG